MGRTTSHLKLVEPRADRDSVGPYALRGALEDHGHPGLRLAWRHEPEALCGRYAVLLLDRVGARLPAGESAILRNAARAMAVRHPATVRVRDLVGDRDGLAVVTDHVPGLSLETILARRPGRPLPREVSVAIAKTVLEALDDIHSLPREKGRRALPAAHGDVCARNVLLADEGSVRLLGFGLPLPREAFGLEDPAAGSNTTGELWFPTPEGDQFAVGLLLLRACVPQIDGLSPSRGPGPATDQLRSALQQLDLDDPVLPVLLQLLAARSEHRYPSCARAAEAIGRLQEEDETLALARFAAQLHQDEFEETDVRRGAPSPAERVEQLELDVPPVDLSVTALSPEDAITAAGAPLERAEDNVTAPARAAPQAPSDITAPSPIDASITALSAEAPPSGEGIDEAAEEPADSTAYDPDTTSHFVGEAPSAVDSIQGDELASVQMEPPPRPASTGLSQPANEWAIDGDEEEGVRTVPAGAAFERRAERGLAPVSQPGRTVPYSPAFVPRASKWRPEERAPLPELDLSEPWALGLLSGTMDAVGPLHEQPEPRAIGQIIPDSLEAETRPFVPAPASAPPFQSETTAIPLPQTPRRPGSRRASGRRRRRRSGRLSEVAERMGLYALLRDSWVLTLFTVGVLFLLAYSGWQIWERTHADGPSKSRLMENVEQE